MATRFTFLLILVLSAFTVQAAEVRSIETTGGSDHRQLVLALTGPVEHQVFALQGPDRIVIDLKQTTFKGRVPGIAGDDALVTSIRTGIRKGTDLRVVIDLKRGVQFTDTLLSAEGKQGHRLVVDLAGGGSPAAKPDVEPDAPTLDEPEQAVATTAAPVVEMPAVEPRDIVIAIDAGHGGADPGAIGAKGSREKDVVLAIAKRLKRRVDAEPGMKGVLVRTGDYFIPLRKRMQIARKHKADFVVSLHADAFKDNRARGSSVYVLSKSGASSEAARWLAEKENAADLVGGVSLDDKDQVLASVLLDLSQTATMQASYDAASEVLRNLRKLGPVHASKVQNARFAVLKSPDIPSMLVETAFISNPTEEKKLLNGSHQELLANAVIDGVKSYFALYPPPGTLLAMQDADSAAQTYVCVSGDTLSGIASRYRVSLARLRQHNGLNSDTIHVGQVLQIPIGS